VAVYFFTFRLAPKMGARYHCGCESDCTQHLESLCREQGGPQTPEDGESSSGCVVCGGGKVRVEKFRRAEAAIQVGQHCFSGTRRLQYQGKRVQAGSRNQLSLSGAPHHMDGHAQRIRQDRCWEGGV